MTSGNDQQTIGKQSWATSHLCAEDIAEFYDRLTQIRQQEYMAKHGHWLSTQTEADAARSIQDSACIG